MRVLNIALSLTAGLILGAGAIALAGPQSLLDPYANVQAPKSGSSSIGNTNKDKKSQLVPPAAKTSQTKPASQVVTKKILAEPPTVEVAPSKDRDVQASADSSSEGGLIAGTKQIAHGIVTTTKGAVSPFMVGTKKVGSATGHLIKGSGSLMANGAEKVKDGSVAAGGKMMGAPKAIGHGLKVGGGKLVDGTQVAGEKIKDGSCAVGSKLIAFPKLLGRGIASCASTVKDGAGAAGGKIAEAPGAIGHGLHKLNPFKHEKPQVATAPSFQN